MTIVNLKKHNSNSYKKTQKLQRKQTKKLKEAVLKGDQFYVLRYGKLGWVTKETVVPLLWINMTWGREHWCWWNFHEELLLQRMISVQNVDCYSVISVISGTNSTEEIPEITVKINRRVRFGLDEKICLYR